MPTIYQRPVYDSPGVGRMSDLIARRGEIASRLALRQGDISAQRSQQLAGIVGGTMNQLAQQYSDTKARQAEDQRRAEQERAATSRQAADDARRATLEGRQDEQHGLSRQAQQRQLAETGQALNERVTKARFTKSDGKGGVTYDTDGMHAAFTESGIGDRFPSVLQDIKATQMTAIKFAQVQRDLIDDLARTTQGAIRAGVDPVTALETQIEFARGTGMDSAQLDTIQDIATNAPEKIPTLLASLRRPGDPEKPTVLSEGAEMVDSTGRVIRKNPKTFAPERSGDGGQTKALTNAQVIKADADYQSALAKSKESYTKAIDRQSPDLAPRLTGKGTDGQPDFPPDYYAKAKAIHDAENQRATSLYQRTMATANTGGPQAQASGGNDMVMVRLPDGRTGSIPRANLAAAKRQGATEVR